LDSVFTQRDGLPGANLQLQVEASNGRFSGSVLLYCDLGDIRQQAEVLAKFPRSLDDVREVALGNFDPEYANGGVRLLFRCRDTSGHVAVDVRLRSDRVEAGSEVDIADFVLHAELAAIDSFVKELRNVDPVVGDGATLVGAP
jgi:hypothetical protein